MKTREFMIRKEYRRAAWIAALGILSAPLLAVVLGWWLDLRSGLDPGVFVVLVPIPAVLLYWVYRIRLRIDDRGISRRILVGWTRWSWDDFECGRIERGKHVDEYVRVPRKRGEPTLSLSLFPEEAVLFCRAEIEKRLRPAPIVVQDGMTLRFPKFLPIQTTAQLDASGIRLTRRGKTDFYPWEAVSRVVVMTTTPEHRDFLALEIQLPKRKIILQLSRREHRSMYVGPEPKEVRAYLERHIGQEKLVLLPRTGLPRTRKALELARKQLAMQHQSTTVGNWFMGGICLLLAGIQLWHFRVGRGGDDPLFFTALALLFPALFWITWWALRKQNEKMCLRRERELDEAEKQLDAEQREDEPEISSGW